MCSVLYDDTVEMVLEFASWNFAIWFDAINRVFYAYGYDDNNFWSTNIEKSTEKP